MDDESQDLLSPLGMALALSMCLRTVCRAARLKEAKARARGLRCYASESGWTHMVGARLQQLGMDK